MDENKMIERRKYPRMNVICSVTIKNLAERYTGIIRNICAYGICVETEHDLSKLGGDLGFEFSLPNGPIVKVKGVIQWGAPHDNVFLYGIRFTSISFFSKIRLMLYINREIRKFLKTNP